MTTRTEVIYSEALPSGGDGSGDVISQTSVSEEQRNELIDGLKKGIEKEIVITNESGTTVLKPILGGSLDYFINRVRSDLSEVVDEELTMYSLVNFIKKGSRLVPKISLKSRMRAQRSVMMRSRGIRNKTVMREPSSVAPPFEEVLELMYTENNDTLEQIQTIFLLVNSPDDYLLYKWCSTPGSENSYLSFVEERGLWNTLRNKNPGWKQVFLKAGVNNSREWSARVDEVVMIYRDRLRDNEITIATKRERSEEEGESDIPSKRAKMQAIGTKNNSLYQYLCLYLDPHHDFLGGRSETKDKMTGELATSFKNNDVKQAVMERVKRVDDFKDRLRDYLRKDDIPYNYDYRGTTELINLMKIMQFIDARQKCISLSFKESSFTPSKVDSSARPSKGNESVLSSINEIAEYIISNLFGTDSGRIYRDASGTDFIKGLSEKGYKPITQLGGDVPFAEKLLDGAGPRSFSAKDGSSPDDRKIRVNYVDNILLHPYSSPISSSSSDANPCCRWSMDNWGKYIVEGVPEVNQIQVIPYFLTPGSVINNDVKREFKICLPYSGEKKFNKDKKVENKLFVSFDPFVNDLALIIKYYMDLMAEAKKGNDEEKQQTYENMIWVLLNLKRAGDHGQAERALVGAGGIFESGDHLASAYGMMIDAKTLFRYTTELVMYKTASTVEQVSGMILTCINYIRTSLSVFPITVAFSLTLQEFQRGVVAVAEKYDKDIKMDQITGDAADEDKKFLLTALTLVSALRNLMDYVGVISSNFKTPLMVLFAKTKSLYERYRKTLQDEKRTEPSKLDLAKAVLEFYTNKNKFRKIVSGFDTLIRVVVEISSSIASPGFEEFRELVEKRIVTQIQGLTGLEVGEMVDSSGLIINQLKKYLNENEYTSNVLVKMFSSQFKELQFEVTSVLDQIRDFSDSIKGLSPLIPSIGSV